MTRTKVRQGENLDRTGRTLLTPGQGPPAPFCLTGTPKPFAHAIRMAAALPTSPARGFIFPRFLYSPSLAVCTGFAGMPGVWLEFIRISSIGRNVNTI